MQEEGDVDLAIDIIKKIYEVAPRAIRHDQKNGFAFPADAEVLSYAMQFVKKQRDINVCEIACARGEIGILLAYAGAKKVVFNDIDEDSIQDLRNQISQHPGIVQEACQIDEGSCFNLLNRNPSLENRIGLIMCRNLIHYFTNQQQSELFALTKRMLRRGGQAIFTSNCIYTQYWDGKTADPQWMHQGQVSSFTLTKVLIHDFTDETKGYKPCHTLFSTIEPCSDQLVSGTETTEASFYQKDHTTNFKWKKDNEEAYNKLGKNIKEKVTRLLKAHASLLQQIPSGNIRLLTAHVRAYNPLSLTTLFKSHGFEVIETFLVNKKGHLCDSANEIKEGKQIGIVVSYP